MSVDLSSVPAEVSVTVGQQVDVALPTYTGSGNAWSARCLDGPEVANVSVVLGEPPARPPAGTDGTTPPPATFVVAERAVVSGVSPGIACWRLVLARPFGPPVPLAEHDLLVSVTG